MLNALGIEQCSDIYQKRGILKLLFSETSCQSFFRIALGLGSTQVNKYCIVMYMYIIIHIHNIHSIHIHTCTLSLPYSDWERKSISTERCVVRSIEWMDAVTFFCFLGHFLTRVHVRFYTKSVLIYAGH